MRPTRLLVLLALCACLPTGADDVAGRTGPLPTQDTPPGIDAGTACWVSIGTPPVVATLEDEVVVEPAGLAPDGTLRTDPVTKIARRDLVVSPGTETWFEAVCPAELTEDRVATLQRALAARGYYAGPITGALNAKTQAAVRAFQAPLGIDSPTLSRDAAERIGLVAVRRPS